jgi:ADP-ribose pyrophosphatase YjhB (NUDIX family)
MDSPAAPLAREATLRLVVSNPCGEPLPAATPPPTASSPSSPSPPHSANSSPSRPGSHAAAVVHDPAKRLVDADGYRMRAGCIAFRFRAEGSSEGIPPQPQPQPQPQPHARPSADRTTPAAATAAAAAAPHSSPSQPLPLVEVALVASSSRAGAWILPAGGVEAGEVCGETASRESLEEGGLRGPVWPLAWLHDHPKKARTAVYAQLVEEALAPDDAGRAAGYADAGARERRWLGLREAEALLTLAPLPQQLASFRAGLAALAAEGDAERAAALANAGEGVVRAAGLDGKDAGARIWAWLKGRKEAARGGEEENGGGQERGIRGTRDGAGAAASLPLSRGPEAAAAVIASPAASTTFPVPHFAVA